MTDTSHNSHLSDPRIDAKSAWNDETGGGHYGRFPSAMCDPAIEPAEAQRCASPVDFYLAQSQAENTRRAYRSDIAQFEAWGGTIPASAEQVALYIAESAGTFAVSTLKRRVAAIAGAHRDLGGKDPTKTDLVKQVLRGIERHHGVRQKQALPLLQEQLEQIVLRFGASVRDARDRALLLVGFHGALRGSELLSLTVEDCLFDETSALLSLRKSKTDQLGKGRWVAMPRLASAACPVRALEHWLERSGHARGALFRPLHEGAGSSNTPLTVRSLSRLIQTRVAQIGLNPQGFSSHSLRAGFVTSQMNMGLSAAAIMRQTGHRSSDILKRYDRPLSAWLPTALKGLREPLPRGRAHKEIRNLRGKGTGEAIENRDGGVFKTALEAADISPVDIGVNRQGLLRDAPLDSEFPEIVSNDTLSLHVEKTSSCC